MEKISSNIWLYSGSTVLFNHTYLGDLLNKNTPQISLRQALSWRKGLPDGPPNSAKTVLITGLETIMETVKDSETADNFLLHRVQYLLRQIQQQWTNVGIVLTFTSPAAAFELTLENEDLLFHRRDRITINLSNGLWDGSAPENMRQIVTGDTANKKEEIVGYYVSRIS
jgi:hypothetical protein